MLHPRKRWITACGLAAALLAAGSAGAVDAPADSGATTPVGVGPSWSVEATSSYHAVQKAYFGAANRNDNWNEGFACVRLNFGSTAGAWGSAGVVGMSTLGTDYYGTHDAGDAQLDQLVAGFVNVAGSGLDVTAGRQNLVLGDGFLIGDGYRDHRAALWNIPLSYFDAVKGEWHRGPAQALMFGANLSASFADSGVTTKGQVFGGEAGWNGGDAGQLVGTWLQRNDTGTSNRDATAFSLRGSWTRGTATVFGEGVLEGGTQRATRLAGRGGHAGIKVQSAARWTPMLKGEYFRFSGDDPATAEDESYDPWMYRWSDWSQYYVGDLVSSTIGDASDMRIWELQLGLKPAAATGVRLLAHRMDLDRPQGIDVNEGTATAFAYEYDIVLEQGFGDRISAYVMGAWAQPLAAAKAGIGSANSSQVFASVTVRFGSAGGE